MSLLLLEALGALVLLVFIVWWTMFSGRKNGEWTADPQNDNGNTGNTGNTGDSGHISAISDAKPGQTGPTGPKKH